MLEPPLLITFAVTQLFGLIAVVFIVLAAYEDRSHASVAATNSAVLNFIWHPVLCSLGMTYLFGLSALAFRILRSVERIFVKIFHVLIHGLALGMALWGLIWAIQMKNAFGAAHFQSIHSIIGLMTIILFGTQWVVSIPVFLWPKAPGRIRGPGISVHVCLGVAVFICGAMTTISGLNQNWAKTVTSVKYYKVSAFFYLMYSLLIVFTLTLNKYKRAPDF